MSQKKTQKSTNEESINDDLNINEYANIRISWKY